MWSILQIGALMTEFKWAAYWRNSLADADSSKGIFTRKNISTFQQVNRDIRKTGKLDSATVKQLFKNESSDHHVIKITYRPNIRTLKLQHGNVLKGNYPEIFTALVSPLWVNREGYLFPAGPVIVPRELLSPLDDSQFTLGTVESLDVFLTRSSLSVTGEVSVPKELSKEEQSQHSKQWRWYVQHCADLYQTVCNNLDNDIAQCYVQPEYSWVNKCQESSGMSKKIIALYDAIISRKPDLALFKSYAERQICDFDDCIQAEDSISLRNGHSSNLYALADAQRDALTHAISMEEGDILAVNGPPGTGKTTYVLSVVASLWVDAAIKETAAPVIFAASTNNQAVTNVIDAFGKDFSEGEPPLSGRWLPDVNSYGAYIPSKSRQEEAQKKFQTEAFFVGMENSDYLERAELFFLEKAAQFTSESTVEDIRQHLHSELCSYQSELEQIGSLWSDLCFAQEQVLVNIGECPEQILEEMKQSLSDYELLSERIQTDRMKWKKFLAAESFWLTSFSWIKSIRYKRDLHREIYISERLSTDIAKLVIELDLDDVDEFLSQYLIDTNEAMTELLQDYNEKLSFLSLQKEAKDKWLQQADSLGVSIASTPEEIAPDFDKVDKQADIKIRFIMFRLAVHYWEASWIIETKKIGRNLNQLKRKNGPSTVKSRWQRRMMLTPCIVSTFHTLPSIMTGKRPVDGCYSEEHIFNFIDLLIVDEAGQVSPEVAGAAFSLAKKALVIGDIHQIAPVRSITGAVDVGNLFDQGLMTQRDDYSEVLNNGRSVVGGSVMHIAQSASRFQYKAKMESGMYLCEHRRCFDDIIMFCNDLCYQGVLQPMRGGASDGSVFPAFGYLHVDGKAEQRAGGSRFNSLEAETIASWIAENREKLEAEYNDKVENIVGVVTPFKGQVYEIEDQCLKQDIKVGKNNDELTVGTVHALQGAERKVVIFSPVYTKHNNGGFIDSSQSMLNVAVSRAKDSFLVFGDMDIMASCSSSEPRGILSKYLFEKEENQLFFKAKKRRDLLHLCPEPKMLTNASEHDAYLLELFTAVKSHISVVSPWVLFEKIESTGILDAMKEALKRNVIIHLYTDRHFNTTTSNKFDPEKEKEFVLCCEKLALLGINVSVIQRVHSKLIMADDCLISSGSFNWFSASRSGKYANMETSMVYAGELNNEIKTQMGSLSSRVYKEYSQDSR